MPTLVLLNGPPGVGKSTLARRYLSTHPEARAVEVDRLRMQLDGWEADESTRLVARDLALAAVEESLDEGRDVLVPQYLGRADFVDRLEALAAAAGARFVHVHLHAAAEVVHARFVQRRGDLASTGTRHPESDVDDVAAALDEARTRLEAMAQQRPAIVGLDAEDLPALEALLRV